MAAPADRARIARGIVDALERRQGELRRCYQSSAPGIGHFWVDDLLDPGLTRRIYAAFPDASEMTHKQSLREHKYVTAQMDRFDPLLEEAIYAFQDPRVVELIGRICSIDPLCPDRELYAGGLSLMNQGNFLNPHIDNSHDHAQRNWRVLNLLFYVTPDWQPGFGGSLELWPEGIGRGRGEQKITIPSRFNRLVVMATHQHSLHSVSPITAPASRCCVSNYYFSPHPARTTDRFHVTSFRGRPEQPLRDAVLQADAWLRMGVRRVFRRGIVKTRHIYSR